MNFDLNNTLCFGIAGNFAHHLEQAGENADFVNVTTECESAPKGLFPYYIPGSQTFLGTYPLSHDEIHYPKNLQKDAHLHLEAEVCVLFEASYIDGQVSDLLPKAFAAFNDCSIRKEGAKKISEKKNWGASSKGVSKQFLRVSRFEEGGEMDPFHIASFVKRDGQLHPYGEDSPVLTYNYFYGKLKTWMLKQLNEQRDFGPLEDLSEIIANAGFPKQILISLGATSYTHFGENEFLQPGDELAVYVYDATQNDLNSIKRHASGEKIELHNSSVLKQQVL
ncbi:MAG: DUF5718 family protein [Thiomicrorhabdus chilensis]|uniref:DUF5718 family protein n=1 Tax=Thiomicrorhabdus chilensis TaxID=63656 RepID=UPI00299E4C02|nr:DUF5718 family protein [Thiomicrorhabdus chilensis]MDX1348393.1 DUF5718 family protein [Thiomicrorhabdus chilensis]